ncbi:MAG TPA: hypothetical protein VLA15_05030 [Desulfurivibrionaceae bacterium]|nr:hypothetical protein [Desulfurivibrionaceae bacterium]
MKRFFKTLLMILGLLGLGLAIFVFVRIRENDRKAALRQAEAEKNQVSQAEAQQLDLGGFQESDFLGLAAPAAAIPAPTPEQWRELRQALRGAALPDLLPANAPVVSAGFGPVRYAVGPAGWRVVVDCRPEAVGCASVALAATALSAGESDELAANINVLAAEGTVGYGPLHGRIGTEGMDKLINEGNKPMIYSEFCSELGCNGSVSFAIDNFLVKVEGSGDLQPWFADLARRGAAGGKR